MQLFTAWVQHLLGLFESRVSACTSGVKRTICYKVSQWTMLRAPDLRHVHMTAQDQNQIFLSDDHVAAVHNAHARSEKSSNRY